MIDACFVASGDIMRVGAGSVNEPRCSPKRISEKKEDLLLRTKRARGRPLHPGRTQARRAFAAVDSEPWWARSILIQVSHSLKLEDAKGAGLRVVFRNLDTGPW